MGAETNCKATLGTQSGEGKALLETDFVQFRSETLRFKILFASLEEVAPNGEFLELRFDKGQRARLELGEKTAAKWADKILNPPSRLDKLGLKPDTKVCLVGKFEAAFTKEVAKQKSAFAEADLVFLHAGAKDDLAEVEPLSKRMPSGAALWIVYPKGLDTIRESDVLNSGRAAQLKDIKVVRFSETETALKFVRPRPAR